MNTTFKKTILTGSPEEFLNNLATAKKRIIEGKSSVDLNIGKDDQGRDFVDLRKVQADIAKEKNKAALKWHCNDYRIRFDDCGFPKNDVNRRFSLYHNFGFVLDKAMKHLKKQWVYICGHYGTGKTSLAMRLCWEFMKLRPTLRPQFLTVNAWVNSLMPGEETQSIDNIRRLVVLDDFDKFNFKSEFQVRSVLRLVEHLIHEDCRVIMTGNLTPDQLIKKSNDMDFQTLLDRVGVAAKIYMQGRSKR